MAVTNFSPLLGLALPTTGDLSGTWGTAVNDQITQLLDDAVAGTVTLSADADVTLSTTNGAANQARNAIILLTGARTALRTITAPAQSKIYFIINLTSGGFGAKIVGSGPTTGITVGPGTQVVAAWNGTDFVVAATGDVVGPASATDNAITRFDATTGKLLQNSLVTIADNGAITAPDVGSVIPFYYPNQAAFPSAATYHGALAHSHADGAMFFAHGGVWIRLLDVATTVTVAQGGTGITSFGTGIATFLGTPSSANLAATLTDETGTGVAVFGTNPTLTGVTLAGEADCADNLVTRATLKDYAVEGSAIGNVGATRTFDLAVANFFSATVDQACTFTFSNPPAAGDFGCFVLELTNGGAFAITYPASVDFIGGVAPTLTAAGVDQLAFTTRDGGTTFFAFVAGLDIKSP
jgi:hypothetical protein